ncbi:hypothetical protein [Marivirga sp.]|uniref:hypothetical protein n=1 Tax=Marivirga sp. TaxID=2018662 RepID=UPI002D7F76EA|nr:hypothetical protein [Marivirga sp.]HET8860075.1 hypothetical protein [Marivirga sp.]
MRSLKSIVNNSMAIQFCMLILFTLASCELLEENENFSARQGLDELPKLEAVFGNSSDFNLSSPEGSSISILLSSNQDFNRSISVFVSLNSVESEGTEIIEVESLPFELELDIEDIRNITEVEVTDGDKLFFTFQSTIEGNEYLFSNTALSASVICNSMISTAEDTWTGNGVSNNGPSFPPTSTAANITITPMGDNNYLISDISAGWLDAIGFRPVQEGIYNDECNTITWVERGGTVQFEFVDPEIPGNYDPITETLTIYWSEITNDFSGQSIFTKNN